MALQNTTAQPVLSQILMFLSLAGCPVGSDNVVAIAPFPKVFVLLQPLCCQCRCVCFREVLTGHGCSTCMLSNLHLLSELASPPCLSIRTSSSLASAFLVSLLDLACDAELLLPPLLSFSATPDPSSLLAAITAVCVLRFSSVDSFLINLHIRLPCCCWYVVAVARVNFDTSLLSCLVLHISS